MRISRTKTEYKRCTHHDQDREQWVEVRLDGEVIKSVDGFKYLGSTITVDGSEEREVTRDTGGMEELEGGVRSAM